MKDIFIFLFLFHIQDTIGQNLVNNSGFEDHSQCPIINVFSGISNWNSISNHFGTPDYYNVCGDPFNGASVPTNWLGYQTPYEGSAYIGISVYNTARDTREYVQTRLASPLIAGRFYRISFFASLADYSTYATANIGVVMSNDSIVGNYGYEHISLVPSVSSTLIISDKVNWTQVTGVYKANGGEKFLTLGNFYSDEQTSKILLDSASLGFAYYFIDNVKVLSISSTTCSEFTVYPNPSKGKISIKLECENIKQIRIYSAISELVKEIVGNVRVVNLEDLPAGMYLLVLTTDNNKKLVKRIIKSNK